VFNVVYVYIRQNKNNNNFGKRKLETEF